MIEQRRISRQQFNQLAAEIKEEVIATINDTRTHEERFVDAIHEDSAGIAYGSDAEKWINEEGANDRREMLNWGRDHDR